MKGRYRLTRTETVHDFIFDNGRFSNNKIVHDLMITGQTFLANYGKI